MSKTTIDGLAVRTPSSADQVGSSQVVGGHLMDDFTPVRKQTKTRIRTIRQNSEIDGEPKDFLKKSENAKVVGTGDKDESDWSDLLEQLGDSPSPKKSSEPEKKYPTKEKGRKSQRKKRVKIKKKRHIVRNILLVVLVLIVVGVGGLFIWGDGLISRLTNGKSGLIGTIWSLVSEEIPFETGANGRTNILVFGTEGYDMNGTYGNGVHDGAQLTDSIMVISFDQETKDVALLSLPRDLKVPAACYAGKVNEVFTCNNMDGQHEEAGAQALMEQVGLVLGIEFQYWAHINWGSLVQIVDTIGGITVTLDEDIYDYGYTGAVITAGVPTHLDGEAALGVSRARYGTNGGDFTRGASQQKVVMAVAQKLIDEGVGFTEILGLLNILGDNLRTNFSSDNIKAAVHMMSGFDVASIRNVLLIDYNTWEYQYVTTAMINDTSYVVPSAIDGTAIPGNYTRIQEYVAQMFSSNPAMREGAGIAIFNATGEIGVAGAEQVKLEDEGYPVYSIGDAAEEDCTEKYCLYALGSDAPGTQKMLEARYGIAARPGSELPEDIMAGYADFVVIIGQVEEGE